ncbi:methylmalonyl-CoA epimerase [Robertmurraya korlensis]|uniref:methylmalonyl-CoA epimerase n=1 Tax=Robertmurraya korlensis TaxID=519977 RepID=UPI0008250BAB|nr:methylmalonyl-CoA epimerase [Robertmurraya korlensis]
MEKVIKNVDHIGIAVKSIDSSLPFYIEVLGLKLVGIEEVPSEQVKVAFIDTGNVMLELLEATNFESAIYKFVEKRGEGIHHIALGVNSIESRIQELKEKGVQMIHNNPKEGAHHARVAFMHPKSTHHVLLELCQRDGGSQNDRHL